MDEKRTKQLNMMVERLDDEIHLSFRQEKKLKNTLHMYSGIIPGAELDPRPGHIYTVPDIIYAAVRYRWFEIISQFLDIDNDLQSNFEYDGCSCYYDKIDGTSILVDCFRLDCSYFIGGNDAARLKADLIFTLGVLDRTGNPEEAQKMFGAVRFAGGWPTSFGWGFGQI